MLTAEQLRELVRYDSETGLIFRRRSRDCRKGGIDQPIGHLTDRGYIECSVQNRSYKAHRLAWLYMHGEWPTDEVDHINHIKSDNRIVNLRLATKSENVANVPLVATNTLGVKGVHFDKKNRRYQARIYVNKKAHFLGNFPTIDEAAHAYNKGAILHFGEFACLNPVGADKFTSTAAQAATSTDQAKG